MEYGAKTSIAQVDIQIIYWQLKSDPCKKIETNFKATSTKCLNSCVKVTFVFYTQQPF